MREMLLLVYTFRSRNIMPRGIVEFNVGRRANRGSSSQAEWSGPS